MNDDGYYASDEYLVNVSLSVVVGVLTHQPREPPNAYKLSVLRFGVFGQPAKR